MTEMSGFANPDFERVVRALDDGVVRTSPRAFSLVLADDLVINAVLHPNDERVVIECFVCDAAPVSGPPREALVNALLALNDAGLRGRQFVCGLDSRSFVTLCGSVPLDGLDAEGLGERLDYLRRQALRVRELVRVLSLRGAGLRFELHPFPRGANP